MAKAEFTNWGGSGECPLEPGALVTVQYRDGSTWQGQAGGVSWEHRLETDPDHPFDVVAYLPAEAV